MKKFFVSSAVLIIVLSIIIRFGNTVLAAFENDMPSESIGPTHDGSLVNGKRLPASGDNFVTYSYLGSLLGRNSVHSRVKDVVLNAYKDLHKKFPEKKFVYGETSWPSGGPLPPHKTHQTGLSVDFFVPVVNTDNESVPLPVSIFNKFGYNIEFDDQGRYDDLSIDFEAMAAHIYFLRENCKKHNMDIWRVIFDPALQPCVFETYHGNLIKEVVQFSKKRSWVRHDEHYHVDFILKEMP